MAAAFLWTGQSFAGGHHGKHHRHHPERPANLVSSSSLSGGLIQRTVIHYNSDEMNFTPQAYADLDRIAILLMDHPKAHITIDGYADKWRTLDGDGNPELSRERAQDVAYDLEAGGALPGQMTVHDHGATEFVATNRTEAGRAQNRRVIITQD